MTFLRRWPFLLPLVVGTLLRIVAAFSGHGWFAPDDYDFAVQQGGDWLRDPTAPFASPIRSPLLSWIVWGLMRVATQLGADDPATRLQCVYAALGGWSLVAIPATWALARRRLGEDAAQQAAWLTAAFALMPRVATRGLIEVMAIPPLMWSLWAADTASSSAGVQRFWRGLFAGALLGAAALLRFQLGILFLPIAATMMLAAQPRRRAWAPLGGLAAGGLAAAIAQGCIDAGLHRPPLGTIRAYLAFNEVNASTYGTSAWYVYLGHFALYSIPPATFVLAPPFWRAARTHHLVALCLGWFVFVHACIGHKEDRFMYSVLPVFFVLLGAALAHVRLQRPWGARAFRWYWAVNIAALGVIVFSDAQRNLTLPLLHIARQPGKRTLAAVGYSTLPRYYAGDETRIAYFGDVDALAGARPRADYILLRNAAQAEQVARSLPHCAIFGVFEGDFADRMVLKLNPRHNGRRAPTALLACDG